MNALTYIGSSDGFRLAAAGVLVPAVAWLLAWSITWICRRASAATRHLVWLMAFVAMAAWVPFALVHPGIGLPILPPKSSPPSAPVKLPVFLWQEKPEPVWDRFPAPRGFSVSTVGAHVETPGTPTLEIPRRTSPWFVLLSASWAAGVVMLCLKSLAGGLRLRRVMRASRVPDGEALRSVYSELCASVGLRRLPRLSITTEVAIPLVTGLWRPHVILPETACLWSKSILRTALIHELAHVRRNDLLSSAFARLVVAIYWFNPFAWLALRALEAEAEMAADDWVVTLESQPVSYAESLVALLRDIRKGAGSPFPAIGMLRRGGHRGKSRAHSQSLLSSWGSPPANQMGGRL